MSYEYPTTHAKGFISGGDFINRYCEAFGLSECNEGAVCRIVYNKAKNCPICGSRPRLFWNCISVETPAAVWSTGKYATKNRVVAGVILCKCGRSSLYFDERVGVNTHDPEKLFEPENFANKLSDTWNNLKP